MAYTLGNRVTTVTSKNPELSSNGGDYYFYETLILKNGEVVGTYYETSASFDYCNATNNFTECIGLYCKELGNVSVAKRNYDYSDFPDGEITIEEFLNW